jgi:hypothetical protein
MIDFHCLPSLGALLMWTFPVYVGYRNQQSQKDVSIVSSNEIKEGHLPERTTINN